MPKQGQKVETHGPYEKLLALLAYDYGVPSGQISQFYNISTSTLFRWVHKHRDDVQQLKRLLTKVSMDGIPEGNPAEWMT